MNNLDLRKEIWSYLRKKPHRRCSSCYSICMWNKNKIIKESIVFWGEIWCLKCFYSKFFIY